MSKQNSTRFAKMMPGVQQYVQQALHSGVQIESSKSLFASPFYVFPPSALDENNYDLVEGYRFLSIIATRASTQNGTRMFPTPQEMLEWINWMKEVKGITEVVGDIALEVLNAFGEVDEDQYRKSQAANLARTRRFVLDGPAEEEEEESDPFEVKENPAVRHVPDVDTAMGN